MDPSPPAPRRTGTGTGTGNRTSGPPRDLISVHHKPDRRMRTRIMGIAST